MNLGFSHYPLSKEKFISNIKICENRTTCCEIVSSCEYNHEPYKFITCSFLSSGKLCLLSRSKFRVGQLMFLLKQSYEKSGCSIKLPCAFPSEFIILCAGCRKKNSKWIQIARWMFIYVSVQAPRDFPHYYCTYYYYELPLVCLYKNIQVIGAHLNATFP